MEKYITVNELIYWLLHHVPEDAIICSSEEGNAYPIDWSDLSYANEKEGYDGYPTVYIG